MPHQIIEYSENLSDSLNELLLIQTLHDAVASMDCFPLTGLRTRAVCRHAYAISDRHPDNAFVHVTLRIAEGRSDETKRKAGEQIFAALTAYLSQTHAKRPLAISFEIQEIDSRFRWRKNNLPDYFQKRYADSATTV